MSDAKDMNETMREKGSAGVVRRLDAANPRKRLAASEKKSKAEKKPPKTMDTVAAHLTTHPEWKGRLSFNDLTQSIHWERTPPWSSSRPAPKPRDVWNELDYGPIQEMLRRQTGVIFSQIHIEHAVLAVAEQNRFHPVREYLESLRWDGVPRVDRMLIDYAGAKDAIIVEAMTAGFVIGAVARVYEPGCKVDTMLILEGKQGIGKSRLLKALFGKDLVNDLMPQLGNKDAQQHLAGLWCQEIAELDSLRGKGNSTQKAFISSATDRFRPPYGRLPKDVPRTCIFAGTTNKDAYLNDETGGRRFWPVKLKGPIKVGDIEAARDQLWAEAVHRFKAREQWWLTADLEKRAATEQEGRFTNDPWEETLRKELDGKTETTATICFEILSVEASQQRGHDGNRVAKALSRLGFERRRKRDADGSRPWTYQRKIESIDDEEASLDF